MHRKEKNNDKKFVLRIDSDLKEKADAKAISENRSLNKYIVNLIQIDLKPKEGI